MPINIQRIEREAQTFRMTPFSCSEAQFQLIKRFEENQRNVLSIMDMERRLRALTANDTTVNASHLEFFPDELLKNREDVQLRIDRQIRLEAFDRDRRQLCARKKPKFPRGWIAMFYLFPRLHPDIARDHSESIEYWSSAKLSLEGFQDFAVQRFARSGWQVASVLIGEEGWHRHNAGELLEGQLNCDSAQSARLLTTKEAREFVAAAF